MNKLYSVHDHWTDINKKNDVDIESIDGVITGIKVNGEDYSGSITWESVYSGSIDPEGEVRPFTANVSLTMTATDSIKVVYDGVEYVLPKQVFNEKIYYGAEPASLPADIDFTNCPFLIQILPDTIRVYTETAGLHTLAISQPQSGGGESDFSTAEVTITWNVSKLGELNWDSCPTIVSDSMIRGVMYTNISPAIITVPLYKGKCYWEKTTRGLTLSGNIEEYNDGDGMLITGDGTITIS